MIQKYYKIFLTASLGIFIFIFIQIYHYPLALMTYSFLPKSQQEAWQAEEKDPLTQHIETLNASFAAQMRNEFDLSIQSTIWCHGDPIESITLHIPTGRSATLAEGRTLLVYITDRYTEAISQSKLPTEKPFNPNNLGVQIYFEGEDRWIADGTLERIHKVGGHGFSENQNQVFYSAKGSFQHESVNVCQEPYEEAVKQNFPSALESFFSKELSEKELEVNRVLTLIRKEIEKKYRLTCHAIGGDMTGSINLLGGSFTAFYPCNQDKARKLTLDISEIFLKHANESSLLKKYFSETPFPASSLRIQILFRKNKRLIGPVSYDGKVSMESITLEKGQINYIKEPEQDENIRGMPEVCENESYEEAVETLNKTL